MKNQSDNNLPPYVVIKNGAWYVRRYLRVRGKLKQIWRRCEIETEEFARALVEQIEEEVHEINYPSETSAKKNFGEMFERWFELKVKRKNALRTQEEHRYNFEAYLEEIKDIPFTEVEAHDIQRIVHRYERRGKHRTAKKIHSLVRLVYNDARRLGFFSGENPADKMFPPEYRAPESMCLTSAQVKKLLAAAEKAEDTGLIVRFALETAMRPSEIFGLEWKHIDLKKREIRVRQQISYPKGGGFRFSPPKWRSSRNITISPKLAEELKILQKKQKAKIKLKKAKNSKTAKNLKTAKNNKKPALPACDPVFRSRKGSPRRPQNFSRRDFKDLLTAAGLSSKFTPYALRHTTATILLKKKIPLKQVSALLGHSDIWITAQVYSHYLPEMQREVSASLAEELYK